MSNIDKINSSKFIPPVESKSNVDKNNVGNGENFEKILENAMRVKTSDVGMSEDMFHYLSNTFGVVDETDKNKEENKDIENKQNYDVASLIGASDFVAKNNFFQKKKAKDAYNK